MKGVSMSRLKSIIPEDRTFAEVWERVGRVPLHRIRMSPLPGFATERDLLKVNDHENRLCELIDGVLVEKTMGAPEGYLAAEIIQRMGHHVRERHLGVLYTPDSPFRVLPGQVRLPDVSFVSFAQLPNGKIPSEPIAKLVPELVVEVLSASNTRAEMKRKLKEYFLAGVQLVWFIDPDKRRGLIYTAPDEMRAVSGDEAMDGGDVLPGFRLPLRELFALLPDEPHKGRKGKRRNGKTHRG
jgi:Uma2 family endonuclease